MREPFLFDGNRLFISVSAGISLFPSDALSAEQLLRNADSALYKAKSSGRACYALYTEELTAHAQHRVETAGELRRAPSRTSCECSTSRCTTSRPAARSASRPWCVGSTPSAAWYRQ